MAGRRSFLFTLGSIIVAACGGRRSPYLITTHGNLDASEAGTCLIHEHILVDFAGADKTGYHRWNREGVLRKMLPFLVDAKNAGCDTFFDCTPQFVGRDVLLLRELARASGLNIVTNTGIYGGSARQYLAPYTLNETAEQLASRWIDDFENGIEGTGIRPGFVKISVRAEGLDDVSEKLIRAAAHTHLATGLTICSHTGPATPAFQQIDLLKSMGVRADAFVWVHAQSEKDRIQFSKAIDAGAWVSLDGVRKNNVGEYVEILTQLRREEKLNRVLVSHDAGWYDPDKKENSDVSPYTTIFTDLIPALKANGFSTSALDQIFRDNPVRALSIGIRKF